MGRRLRFTYPSQAINEPIIWELSREFGVVTNIRRANISRDQGWVILELEGLEEDVERAVHWARQKGVTVQPVEGELPD